MGLFKKATCCKCGQEVGMLSGLGIKDGKKLCKNCSSIIPVELYNIIENWDLEQYDNYKKYCDTMIQKKDVYKETHSYSNGSTISLDQEHGLFYINSNELIYDLRLVDNINFTFVPEEFKEGILGDKVKGKLVLEFDCIIPLGHIEIIFSNSAKFKAKKLEL